MIVARSGEGGFEFADAVLEGLDVFTELLRVSEEDSMGSASDCGGDE